MLRIDIFLEAGDSTQEFVDGHLFKLAYCAEALYRNRNGGARLRELLVACRVLGRWQVADGFLERGGLRRCQPAGSFGRAPREGDRTVQRLSQRVMFVLFLRGIISFDT